MGKNNHVLKLFFSGVKNHLSLSLTPSIWASIYELKVPTRYSHRIET